jgi:hypothetical protein
VFCAVRVEDGGEEGKNGVFGEEREGRERGKEAASRARKFDTGSLETWGRRK